jgi:hypothetical protein
MELIKSYVTSESKKYSPAVAESRIRKIRVCCRYSKTDKNPRRFRKKIKFGTHRTLSQKKSQLSASVTEFILCMVNCRDIRNMHVTN